MEQMALQEKLQIYRHELHQYPELSMQEYETTKRLKKWLEEAGVVVCTLPLETGLVAEIKGARPGPLIALRADIDGLPIEERTNLPFASVRQGVSHACGHDVHMTGILGAAFLLNEQKERMAGTVRILFQPGEESGSGGVWFASQPGVMDGVQAVLGFHNKPDLPVGSIGIKEGPLMAGCDRFEIEINGKGGHGGMPERCIDPIAAGSQLVNILQSIVSRRISSLDNAVVSVTRFQAGNTWNVIPDKAVLEGTVRTFQLSVRQKVAQYLKDICEGVALASGTKIDLQWHVGPDPVINDAGLAKLAAETGRKIGCRITKAEPNLAGDDFYIYSRYAPSCYLWVGTEGPYQWHHPAYTVKDGAEWVAAKFFCQLALDTLARFGTQG